MKLTIQEQASNVEKYLLDLYPNSAPFVSVTYWPNSKQKIEFSATIYCENNSITELNEGFACLTYEQAMLWGVK